MATEVTCIVDTDSGAGYDYTSLNAAIIGEAGGTPAVVTSANLAANDEQLTIELRATSGSADTTKTSVTGFAENSTCFVKLKQASPHGGSWNTSVYRLQGSVGANERVLTISDNYTEIDGMQILATPSGQDGSFIYYCIDSSGATNTNIHHSIIRGDFSSWSTGTSRSYAVYLGVDIGAPQYVKRNLIYGFNSASTGDQAAIRSINHTSGKTYVYNNTIVDCRLGIMDGYGDIVAVNNIINDCTTCFSGSFDGSSDYNLSDDATAPGSNSVTSTGLTFADAANDDYHLASTDTAAIGAGIGPSSDANVPTTDIDGDAVSGTTCDIGADEYVASGETGSGTPSLPSITADGRGAITLSSSGTPILSAITAAGAGINGHSGIGTAILGAFISSGASLIKNIATGTPSFSAILTSGAGLISLIATGTPNLPAISADGSASNANAADGSGTPILPSISASGAGISEYIASGAVSLGAISADGFASPPRAQVIIGGRGNDPRRHRRSR